MRAYCNNGDFTVYTIYGFHAVMAYLPSGLVNTIYLDQGRQDARAEGLMALAETHQVAINQVPLQQLEEMAGSCPHQGVVGACERLPVMKESALADLIADCNEPPLLLILDQVQDPHNLGACLRTAAASGCHAVIVPKDNAATLNATVMKVASGAVGKVPFVQVTNLVRVMKQLQDAGVWFYGTAESGAGDIYQQDFTGPMAWVMGGEEKGLRRLTQDNCDVLCHIPTSDTLSCLNVSVATGVCLFETRRQRLLQQEKN